MFTRQFLYSSGILAAALLHFLATTRITRQYQPSPQRSVLDKENEGTPSARLDYIDSLPGLGYNPGFKQYSGYLDVSSSRHLFYWFVESQGNPETDPVVFWTNGGPGCSGLIGFSEEHGPFYYSEKGVLTENPYSWNKVANMLYIEQPAGVGFSYMDSKTDLGVGDQQAAEDNYKFLIKFFERFPEKRSNPFYVSSESYGGHYIPQLTLEILKNNVDGLINFKGFLVGNPFVHIVSNMIAGMETSYYHGLMSKPDYDLWRSACGNLTDDFTKECVDYLNARYETDEDDVDPYALDYPVCLAELAAQQNNKPKMRGLLSSKTTLLPQQLKLGFYSVQGAVLSHQTQNLLLKTLPSQYAPVLYRPCSGYYFGSYLRRPDVREALHVRNESASEWKMCTHLNYSVPDIFGTTIPLYEDLVLKGLRGEHDLNMLVFSGDDDAVCATSGTQEWIWSLGVQPKTNSSWKGWKVNGQTAGYVTNFDLGTRTKASFIFATVHGAGHEVPKQKPVEGLELFRYFLNGGGW